MNIHRSYCRNANQIHCRIFQCDHHSLKLHIRSDIVRTEVIPTQVSHGIPSVLCVKVWVLKQSEWDSVAYLLLTLQMNTQRERRGKVLWHYWV